jgi:hypothetical protein
MLFPDSNPYYGNGACLQHAANPVTSYCVRCGRAMCDLCTFWIGSAIFCPECLSSGASADERSAVTTRGVLSLIFAMLAVFAVLGLFAWGAAGGHSEFGATVLGFVILGLTMGGLSLGLIGREGAKRTGSMLPLIGLIINAVILGIVSIVGVLTILAG